MIARLRGLGPDSGGAAALTLSFCVILAAVAVGVPAVAAPVLAQTGSVNVQDTIYEDTDPIRVEVPRTEWAYLEVENLDNGNSGVYRTTVSSPEAQTKLVDLASIGPSSAGDRIQARLYNTDAKDEELGRDTTRVSGFTGTFTRASYTVTQGRTVQMDATISNPGDAEATETVETFVDGSTVGSRSVTVGPRSSTQVSFTLDTSGYDVGTHEAGLRSRYDGEILDLATLDVQAPDPPNFEVGIDSTNSPVTVGRTLDVRATVTNTGEASASQEIDLVVEGRQRDSTALTLAGGEWATVSLSWQTGTGHAGGHTAVVASDDSSASRAVLVEEPAAPANFDVAIDSINSPVTEGQTLDVTATVTNTGDESDSQEIGLGIGGTQVDSAALALAPGENTTVTLSWGTESGDAGEYETTVTSEDATAGTIALVQPASTTTTPATTTTRQTEMPPDQPQIDLRIDSTSSPVSAGSKLDVQVTVTNRGDSDVSDEVALRLGGDRVDSRSISLGGGESRALALTWQTGSGDAGEHTAVVESSSETAEEPVVVRESDEESDGGTFDVEIESTSGSEGEDDPIVVTAKISNSGPTTDTQVVRMAVDGDERASKEVSLAPGDTRNVSFSYEPASDGSKPTIEVWSEDDEDQSVIEAAPTGGGGNPLTDPLLVGLILLVVGAMAGGYLYVRRRQFAGEGGE